MIKNVLLRLVFNVFFIISGLHAQQGKVDVNFNLPDNGLNGDGFDKPVRTLSLQSDGKLIVGGEYLNLNGIPVSYLSRLELDGTIDASFNTGTGFNGKVYDSYLQDDGKIIIAGSFSVFNGSNTGRLIRLNQDGSQDTTLNTSIGATTGIIYKVCPQPDGKIIIVGSFTKYNNSTVNRIARILPNGTLDTSFLTGKGSALNITNAEVLADGKIILSGNFTEFNGVSANKIVRLNPDGSIDTSFNMGTGFNDDINAMVLQPDGKIILGGKFTSYNSTTANRIIRINEDGTPDTNFLCGTGFSGDAIQTIKIDSFGNIMVGGSFTGSYDNKVVNRIVFLNSNGTLKTDFDTGSGPGSASVYALANASDGSWYIGGSFSIFDGQNQGRLVKVNPDGEHDTGYLASGVGFDNTVQKVLSLDDKKTMVFGNFTKFNGVLASRIVRLLENGLADESFNSGETGANNLIKTAVLQSDNKIILGGSFTKYNGRTCNRLVRILPDGEIDNTFNIGSGVKAQVYALCMQGNKVIVAGNFTTYNDTPTGRIVRLLEDGSRDPDFNAGLGADAIVETVVTQPDGKILVAGRFNTFAGQSFSRLVRLNYDGTIDSDFHIGDGFDKFIYAIALQSDNKIIIGGSFTTYNGTSQKRILRLNTNGSLDTTFESGTGFSNADVLSLLVQPDDRILVAGSFSGTYKSYASLRLIRLLKSGNYDPSFQTVVNGKINTMCFTSDQKLMVGGDFNSISGVSKHRIALLRLCLEATIWNGISWSNGFPSGGKELLFKEDYPNLTTANVCSCTIDKEKTVTLLSDNTLGITFDYSGLGTLVLNDTASLYQDDDEMVNTGIVHAKRKSSPIVKFDFTYWSSPVENQKLIDVSPNSASQWFFSYDELSKSWKWGDPLNSNMNLGRGYSIIAPEDFSNTVPQKYETTFKGIPNNGKITLDLGIGNTFSLIGNPYPSALNADVFLNKNSSNIKGTLYFWTHNTPITDNKYTSNDYAVYNLLGGVGTKAIASGINETIPDGTIASGQGFFVKSKDVHTIEFDNSMRIKVGNSVFFKQTDKQMNSTFEKHRIWLNFENKEGVFKQILLGYAQGATNFYDENFDAETFNGNQFADFYSLTEDKKLVIQGRVLPFTDTDTILLGYRTAIAGNYTISIDHADGNLSAQSVYVEDKITEKIHDLTTSNYTFATAAGTFTDRFVVRYTDKTLSTGDFENQDNRISILLKNKSITIVSSKENIKEVMIYDVSGKLLYNKKKVGNTALQIQNLQSGNQVLLVKVVLQNDFITTKKMLF